MHSSLAHQARQALIDRARKMTPAERLRAVVEHSRLMIKLKEAGEHYRKKKRRSSGK